MADDRLAVSVDEAAALIGLGRDVTWRLVMTGEIASFKVGARRIVPIEGLRAFVAKRAAEAVPA